jgi:ADP-ribose pyrophosphatase
MRRILIKGNFLDLIDDSGWEYVDRPASVGVVSIIGILDECLFLVEQFRHSQQSPVVSLPGGLVDRAQTAEAQETTIAAARREFREETGFEVGIIEELASGPPSPGMTSESVTFFLAKELSKLSGQSLDKDENIAVHLIPLLEVPTWLKEKQLAGTQVDLKVFVGLYLLYAQDLKAS